MELYIRSRPGTQLCTAFCKARAASGYQCSLKPAVMLLLLVVWPKSVTAVVTCSGPYSFCSALRVLWVTGSLLAVVTPAPRVVPVGRMLNLTAFSLPKTCGVSGAGLAGSAISGRSVGPVGWAIVWVTE